MPPDIASRASHPHRMSAKSELRRSSPSVAGWCACRSSTRSPGRRERDRASRGLIVELTTAGGIKGYGETICLLDAIPAVLDNVVIPCAIGKSVDQAESLYRHVLGAGYYHHKRAAVMAICAVEMAMWDAFGKACGQPLYRLWGGAWRDPIEICAYLLESDRDKCVADATRFPEARLHVVQAEDRLRRTLRHRADARGSRRHRSGRAAAARRQRRLDAGHRAAAIAQARRVRPVLRRAAAGARRSRRSCAAAHAADRPDRARRIRVHAQRCRQHRARRRGRRDPARSARSRWCVADRQGRRQSPNRSAFP